jgi:hypothetical protein
MRNRMTLVRTYFDRLSLLYNYQDPHSQMITTRSCALSFEINSYKSSLYIYVPLSRARTCMTFFYFRMRSTPSPDRLVSVKE